tara:strand:- start:2197 stop:2757 length:561 start_codon:yes stop_codon:yes gene_type:complete
MSNRNSILPDKTIVLVGLMGSGKTAIGRSLANRTGRVFVDSDDEVRRHTGTSIAEMFAHDGEEAFRKEERRIIISLLNNSPHVLATGGGAFLDPCTRKHILSKAISVWLHANLRALLDRVHVTSDRPLLRHGNPQNIMQQLMNERYPIYAKANLTVKTSDRSQTWVVDKVFDMLTKEYRSLTTGKA